MDSNDTLYDTASSSLIRYSASGIPHKQLSKTQVALCKGCADAIKRNLKRKRELQGRGDYFNTSNKDPYFTGYLGEALACDWLEHEGLASEFEYEVNCDGNSHGPDFVFPRLLDHGGRPFTIEVKTAGEPYHRSLKIPRKHLFRQDLDGYWRVKEGRQFSVCVAARLDNDTGGVSIQGWIYWNDLFSSKMRIEPSKGDSSEHYTILHNQCHRPRQLIALIRSMIHRR